MLPGDDGIPVGAVPEDGHAEAPNNQDDSQSRGGVPASPRLCRTGQGLSANLVGETTSLGLFLGPGLRLDPRQISAARSRSCTPAR